MITYKTFETGFVIFGSRSRDKDSLREQVKQFINQEVGPEQVVNIIENEQDRFFSVTVWYRAKSQ